MSISSLWTLVGVAFIAARYANAQATTQAPGSNFGESSTYGKEFVVGFMQNLAGSILTELQVIVGTPAERVQFVVETSDQELHRGSVTSESPVVVNIPSFLDFQVLGNDFFERNKGIRIASTDGNPIFVLGTNSIDFLNYGTFLAYPCQLDFEQDTYEYLILSVGDTALFSQFLLVGCLEDTIISIIPTQQVIIPEDAQVEDSTETTVEKDTMHNVTLNKMNTLLVFSADQDLTGTRIISNKPLTVIGGHECANVPQESFDCEPIAIQIPPVSTWGTSFLVAGYAGRTSGQLYFRIVPSQENTTLEATCGQSTIALLKIPSDFFLNSEFPFCFLQFNKPVFLAQLAGGSSTETKGKGDPAISIVSPIDQYVNKIEFVLLPTDDFPNSYISITVPAEHYDPDSILLDGEKVNCEWIAIYNRSNVIVGYGCNVSMPAESSEEPTQHTLSHSSDDGRLSATVYGFSTFPPQGYAYLTGQKLEITDVTDIEGPKLDGQTLEFIKVANFEDVQELPREEDSFSDPIYIPGGMLYGDKTVTLAFVNENGVISFNERWRYSHPERFPTRNFNIRSRGFGCSPFWSDVDIRKSGAVRYATTSSTSRNRRELIKVNQYINTRLLDEDNEAPFVGTWMLVAHWDKVHPSPHGAEDHLGIPEKELDKTNNFQAIVVTNISHTYCVYNYICGELQWSGFGRDKGLVGYIASGGFFSNHPSSGSSNVAEIISCTITLDNKKRRKRQRRPQRAQLLIEIPADPVEREKVEMCAEVRERNRIILERPPIDTNELANDLEPCPPNQNQAILDVGRFIKLDEENPICYVAGWPLRIRRFTITQQCCYDEAGDLITEGVTAGRMLLFHPLLDAVNYEIFDVEYRDRCCDLETNLLCDEYFMLRTINYGEGYRPPMLAVGIGDPHYLTFDRPSTYYHFQGRGTYSTLDVLNEEGNIVFALQGRQGTGECPPGGVTWHTGIAFGEPNILSYQFGERPGFRVFRTAPDRLEITDELQVGVPYYDDDMRSMLLKVNNVRLIAAFYESGVVVRAYAQPYCNDVYMVVEALVPQTYDGRTQGLFGLLDGDPNNDLRLRDGTVLPFNVAENVLYNNYDSSWRIDPEESMFFFQEDRKKRQASDDFRPVFFDQLVASNDQIGFCEGNEQCVFDLVVTNDTEFAERTVNEQKEANDTIDQFENLAPNISGSGTFRVNLREESIYTIKVVDPGDNFTVNVQGGLPPNSLLEELGDGEHAFKWSLRELTNDPLVFVATDTRNVSSTHTPVVEVCACANDGVCTVDGLLTTNTTITTACLCSEAFTGQFCEEDRNGCGEIQCYEGVECLDVPAPGIGAVCGACPLGFTGDGLKCYDVDECAFNLTECKQHCNNTDGSYFCDCFQGYRIIEGSISECEDVNECDENLDDCQQQCVNSIGSYTCACGVGFTLDDNGRTCTADQPCDDGGGCSDICAVIDGEAQCFCPLGYELSMPGGTQCADINECLASPCGQICLNTLGSFECSCRAGYSLLGDGRSCEDIDECTDAALNAVDLCENDPNTQCLNNEGSFECVCVPGYSRTNGTCQRIVEEPPPPPPPVVPPKGIESSVSFISPTLTLSDFTPGRQQLFRRITASAVTSYCLENMCTITLLEGESKTEERPKGGVQAQPQNVAIPSGLVSEDENAQLNITFYIQFSDGFLATEDLTAAVQESEDNFRDGGFLQQAPFPPTDVRGFCDVVVWSLLVQPGGEIFAYDIRLYIPGTEQDVIINLGKTEFYVLEENKQFIPETSVLMQVRGINAIGIGEWSLATTLGCVDPPTIQPTTCPEPPTCPACPTCATCPTCETCPTQPPCPTCETPLPCPTCQTCPACPTQPPCPTCPTCATCPTMPECPTCETCPSPRPCPECPTRPACPTCETPSPCPTCETCPTLPPCPTCETCPTQPACPTCSTETCPPCVCETEQPIPAIHFELEGRALLNNSVIDLQSVGRSDKALLCVTDRQACCSNPFRAGQFYFPSNQQVPNMAANLGFWRGRGPQNVRLSRRETATSPLGIYRCEIPDASGALQNIYITLM